MMAAPQTMTSKTFLVALAMVASTCRSENSRADESRELSTHLNELNLLAQQKTTGQLEPLLQRLQRNATQVDSIHVRFNAVSMSCWGVERYIGQLVLTKSGFASLESQERGNDGLLPLRQRFVWVANEFDVLNLEEKTRLIIRRDPARKERIPSTIALPFFLKMNQSYLKTQYLFELLREGDTTFTIRATPRERNQKSNLTIIIVINNNTLLPDSYHLIGNNGREFRTFKPMEIKLNKPTEEDLLRFKGQEGWQDVLSPIPLERLSVLWD